MTLPQFAPQYELWSTQALRQAVMDRLKEMPKGRKTRTPCIEALRQADQDAIFPKFMDLPAELRVAIYKELLATHAKQGSDRR
jgi:hypothetical protein